MDFDFDLRPSLDLAFTFMVVDAWIYPVSAPAVATKVIWTSKPIRTTATGLGGEDVSFVDMRLLVHVRRDQVPELPISSTIVAPRLRTDLPKTWLVDRLDPENPEDPEVWHCVVHEVAA